jgi:probable HAF family extracellular repeat protein
MDGDKTCTATFTRSQLTVNKTGTGSGTITSSPAGITCGGDCSEDYPFGTAVTLTATADAGSAFVSWSGCDAPSGTTCNMTMDANKTVTAQFEIVYTLNIIKSGVGSGTVSTSPAGIDCGHDCIKEYIAGTLVTLTADPDTGSVFVGWGDCDSPSTNQLEVTMDSNIAITVYFGPSTAYQYEMIDLGTLGGANSWAEDINDIGQIVGSSDTSNGDQFAFLYEGGSMSSLGSLEASSLSNAHGINNSGQITGEAWIDFGFPRAFLYENGVMSSIGTLSNDFDSESWGYGINDSGQIVGESFDFPFGARAFLYEGGSMSDIGGLSEFNAHDVAFDINDKSQIVGESDTMGTGVHAFLYNGGSMTDLGTLGGFYSRALGINNTCQVVGVSDTGTVGNHAFLYEGGVMTDLGVLENTYESQATAINDLGQVAGYATTIDGFEYAFIYQNGTMTELPGGIESAALGINKRGQIVGYSGAHAVLWNPIVEYYCDNDGDGYVGTSVDGTCSYFGCEPEGCQMNLGDDCDDSQDGANINPGAPEINNDGIDNDCDPATPFNAVSGVGMNTPSAAKWRASMAVNVDGDGPIGVINYYYTRQRVSLRSASITSVTASGGLATITGIGNATRITGSTTTYCDDCNFTVQIQDGSPDSMDIMIDGGNFYDAPGDMKELDSGNFNIVEQ